MNSHVIGGLPKMKDDGALFRDLLCAGGPGGAPPGERKGN